MPMTAAGSERKQQHEHQEDLAECAEEAALLAGDDLVLEVREQPGVPGGTRQRRSGVSTPAR